MLTNKMNMDSQQVIRRLALIRYFLRVAIEQSSQSEPLCSISILTLHDATELFLQLSCDHLNVNGEKLEFLKYWDEIVKKLPQGLTHKQLLSRLNRSRVAFKHHGTMPSKQDLMDFGINVRGFLIESTSRVFGLDFEQISLVELIDLEKPKRFMLDARDKISESNNEKALEFISAAFEILLQHHFDKNKINHWHSPLHFEKSHVLNRVGFQGQVGSELLSHLRHTDSEIEKMQMFLKVLALGLDFRRYTRFKLLAPSIVFNNYGDYFLNPSPQRFKIGKMEIEFCFDFVIESALKIQELTVSPNEQMYD